MKLHNVHQGITKNKKRRRVGRGPGSGHGKTCGRGHKGQKSRAGWSRSPIFQGGAMPLVRRVPKRGFNNKFALTVFAVNVGDLEGAFDDGAEVTPATLKEQSMATRRYDVLKILGDGELTKKLVVSAHRFSKSAREKIEKAGGKVIVLPGKRLVGKQRAAAEKAAEGTPTPAETPAPVETPADDAKPAEE